MSYILKALRKSEAERAKGAVPKLTPYQEEPVASRQGGVWPWVAVATLVVNAVIGGVVLWRADVLPWLQERGYEADGPAIAATVAPPAAQTPSNDGSVVAAVEPAEPPPQAEPGPVDAEGDGAPERSASRRSARAAEAVTPEPAASMLDAVEPVPPSLELAPMAPKPPRKPAQIAALATVFSDAAAQTEPPDDEFPWDQEPNGTDFALIDEQPLPPAAQPETPPVAGPYADVPMLWQMPSSFRSGLPSMNISVHVYSPEIPRRFVIIDRRKYWEGDELQDGVSLEAIVPDGVVMAYQGQQFRLTSR